MKAIWLGQCHRWLMKRAPGVECLLSTPIPALTALNVWTFLSNVHILGKRNTLWYL
jgi:hypothetical protein